MQSDNNAWKETLRKDILTAATCTGFDATWATLKTGLAYKTKAPSSLFKYYSGKDMHLEAVMSNTMWYSAPASFNDVFDCDLPVNEESLFQYLIESVVGEEIIRKGSQKWRELHSAAFKGSQELKKELLQLRETMGVSCFSEKSDSILMWSHYANNHRGICVEYELLEFNNQLQFTPVPVIYSDNRPSISSFDLSSLERTAMSMLLESITSKSSEWSYEYEWRIIRDRKACGSAWNSDKAGALLPSITPKSIALGCESPESLLVALKPFCEKNEINLYKMEKDELQYKLNRATVLQFVH